MYAIIESGGKQYKVQEGEYVQVEKIEGEEGREIRFDRVLMIADGERVEIGTPTLKNASVEAEIVRQGKDKKIVVFKYKPKKNYRRKRGHRQPFTKVRIKKISAG
ncbi:MAG: 50S ribosomal protein L21 [bacterium]